MKRLKLDSQMNSKHFEPVVGGGYVFEISLEFEATALGIVAPTPVPAISSNSQETSKKLVAPTAAGSTYLEVRKINFTAFSLLCWIFQSLLDNFGHLSILLSPLLWTLCTLKSE